MAKKTYEEIHSIIVGTFETELGKRCLEHLQDKFINREIYKVGMSFEEAAFRAGEASVVKKLVDALINKKGTNDGR